MAAEGGGGQHREGAVGAHAPQMARWQAELTEESEEEEERGW